MHFIRSASRARYLPVVLFLLGITLVLFAGCLGEQGGRQAAEEKTVNIGNILENPGAYNGTTLQISGKVVNQCGSGCWFFLDDGTGSIYVDLLPNNFAIPPMVGSKVTVKGTILVHGKDVTMVGTTVMTDFKVYP
jgi:uncharacterized protein YdeI (BOF family)